MGKSLVIVESPAKAKTINKYLGADFIVKSSVGHIRDLPKGGGASTSSAKERAAKTARTKTLRPEQRAAEYKSKTWGALIRSMGVDPEHGWRANYQVLPGKEKVVNELKKFAQDAPAIYLATDLDREGEAIAWHLQQVIGGDSARYQRVVFNEITAKAIKAAFEHPGEINQHRVEAQQARRFLDRVVGYMVSPLLWKKVARGLSAGRVQSVAVRLIVEREREIRAFQPEEYWTLHADMNLASEASPLRFEVVQFKGEKFRPLNQAQVQISVDALATAAYKIARREDKPSSSKPSAPFITSTLQQAASTRLGFSVKKTMTLAQRLYEAGHITYMRTDSTNLSLDSVEACRTLIGKEFGAAYLPEEPRVYGSRDGAQEAHEAIRPSEVTAKPGTLADMEADARRLYELIWQQFVACQMKNAEFTLTRVEMDAADHLLRINGRVVRFDGFQRVLPTTASNDEDRTLPDMKVEQVLQLRKLDPVQHFTKPPARYSEAALVKELEKRGIGRPSTYAAIISTIQDRGYARLDKRRFYAEKIGEIVTDRLVENFDDLLDYSFTARMEAQLDQIASGELGWKKTLDRFYKDFSAKLDYADEHMRGNQPTLTDIACEKCARPMTIRNASTGVFLGCSGYALPLAERCKGTMNLTPGSEAVDADADDEAETRDLRAKRRCPKCDAAMENFLLDATRRIHICGNNPECDGFEVEQGSFRLKGYDGPSLDCDKCSSPMHLKTGRFGKYFGCTNEDCKNTRKLLRNGQAAPPKVDPIPMPELRCEKVDDYYLLRDGAAGLFLAASQYPRFRETRAPLLSELLAHADELDTKYQYLLEAPRKNPIKDADVIVRFDKARGLSYLRAEKDGKAAGWRADYREGRWVETTK